MTNDTRLQFDFDNGFSFEVYFTPKKIQELWFLCDLWRLDHSTDSLHQTFHDMIGYSEFIDGTTIHINEGSKDEEYWKVVMSFQLNTGYDFIAVMSYRMYMELFRYSINRVDPYHSFMDIVSKGNMIFGIDVKKGKVVQLD